MVFGDLDSIHPAIQNVADLTPEKMGWEVTKLTDTLCAEWRTELEGIEGFLEHTYPHLPVQVIHGDFGLGNTLYNQNHVSAILDFEFALPDVRIIDFAAGLTLMMLKVAPGDVLARASHFYSGYRCWIDLTGEEIGAMAEVMTLCVVVSAIWWLGRELEERRGQPGLERLIRLRDLKSWLKVYGASFKEMLVCG
jgi:Ser/Thr protein kinase RdoA (MazF antagonist)